MNKVREGKGAYGYNVASGEYDDSSLVGLIDPSIHSRARSAAGCGIGGFAHAHHRGADGRATEVGDGSSGRGDARWLGRDGDV